MEDIRKIIAIDIKQSSYPQVFDPLMSVEEQLCFYTAVSSDAKLAQYLAHSQPEQTLLGIRSHLLSGSFHEAKERLQSVQDEVDPTVICEYLIEEAKLAGFENRWEECLAIAEKGLRLKPMELTQLCLLQCRASALYELGYFDQALYDCELILSQKALYPEAVPLRYAGAQKIKILLASQGSELAGDLIHSMWKNLARKSFDLDSLLTMIRLEIDYSRAIQRPFFRWALASLSVSHELGDKLYEGLAFMDAMTTKPRDEKCCEEYFLRYTQSFNKLFELYEAYKNKKSMLTSEKRLHLSIREQGQVPEPSFDYRYLLLARYKILIDLKNREIKNLSDSTDWKLISQIFKNGSIGKKEFFEKFWQQKYSRDLHDGVIRTYLHRLKKRLGFPAKSSKGVITIEQTLFLN